MPDCCIGADVIVGFPTETEINFQETYDFLKSLDISYFLSKPLPLNQYSQIRLNLPHILDIFHQQFSIFYLSHFSLADM